MSIDNNAQPARLGVASVSYLNARPLIWGLEHDAKIRLDLAVPSRLIDLLGRGVCDVALLPTIDYQSLPDLRIVPSAGIGCDGPTLTVRIFARCPLECIRSLACDPDSHTSVALARIILAQRYNLHPPLVDLSKDTDDPHQARLLIGDKVVCQEPPEFNFQYDLGEQWKQLTGLPFAFAVWTARSGIDLGDLPGRLERAKRAGLEHIDQIVTQYAVPRGWPAGLARQYLSGNLKFDIGPVQLSAIREFHRLAAHHGIIEHVKPLQMY